MAETQQNITPAQMMELMKQFAAELKKPSADEQAEIDAKKARAETRVKASIENAKREQRQKELDQAACSHTKPYPYQGQIRVVAPLHNDGLHHPHCLFCHKEFKPFAPAPETIPLGMTLGDLNGVTPQHLEAWGNQYEKQQQAKELVSELVK